MFTLAPLNMQSIKHVYVQSPKQTVLNSDSKRGSLVNSAQPISHINNQMHFLYAWLNKGVYSMQDYT